MILVWVHWATGDEKALDQAVKEKKAAEENVLKLEMTGNNWKLQKEEMIKQENALAQARRLPL